MANATTMTYGDYSFIPVPLVNIKRDSINTGNRENPVNHIFTMQLSGTLTPLPSGTTGLIEIDTLMEELRTAFDRSGKLLEIKCDSSTIMQLYPEVVSIDFQESNNNWVQTVPFTIELTYCYDELNEHPTGETPPFIEDFTEEWNFEFIEDQKHFTWDLSSLSNQDPGGDYTATDGNNPFEARVTHAVSAKGKPSYLGPGLTGTYTNAADNAMAFLTGTFAGFGYDANDYGHALVGWTNLVAASSQQLDHMRTHVINETDGSASLTESWVVFGDNTGLTADQRKATEDFTVNIRNGIQDGKVSVSIEGQVKGYEDRTYSSLDLTTNVTQSAYNSVTGAWIALQDRIFPRAQFIFQQDFSTQLNPIPVSKVIGHQPSRGVLTYAYEFDDRPCAFITGALTEQFSIVDNHPSDVFAKLPVLGRTRGPVLQEITTVTEATREVTIEAVMPLPTGCSSITDLDLNKPVENVENLLCSFETQLTDANNQVFKHADNESWSPLTGRYSRSVGWTYQDCTGTPPSTTFC